MGYGGELLDELVVLVGGKGELPVLVTLALELQFDLHTPDRVEGDGPGGSLPNLLGLVVAHAGAHVPVITPVPPQGSPASVSPWIKSSGASEWGMNVSPHRRHFASVCMSCLLVSFAYITIIARLVALVKGAPLVMLAHDRRTPPRKRSVLPCATPWGEAHHCPADDDGRSQDHQDARERCRAGEGEAVIIGGLSLAVAVARLLGVRRCTAGGTARRRVGG